MRNKEITKHIKKNMYNRVSVMVLNDTFNNISVISWLSVLLVEETGEHDVAKYITPHKKLRRRLDRTTHSFVYNAYRFT